MASEKSFENRIKKYLKEQGCWFVKYWGGGQFTKAGIPDLIVCCGGRFLAIEVKGEKGKASELQLYNIRKINEEGGIGIIIHPNQFEDLKKLCEKLKKYNYHDARYLANKINERG